MTTAGRLAGSIMAGLGGLVAALGTAGDAGEGHGRLGQMPPERRLALAANLERFDKLDPAEQASIRSLDAQLAGLDPVDRDRYREVLRRYHLWLGGLPEDARDKIRETAGTDARFALVAQLHGDERARSTAGKAGRIAGLRPGELGLMSPYQAATLIKTWRLLTDAERADLARKPPVDLVRSLRESSRNLGVNSVNRIDDEAALDARLDNDPEFVQLIAPPRHATIMNKKAAQPAAQAKSANMLRRIDHPFAEFLHFEDHPLDPVDPGHLGSFAAACPGWLMRTIDPLGPDDARHYLSILYRLIYPPGFEFDPAAEARAAADRGRAKAATKPAPGSPRPPAPAGPPRPKGDPKGPPG